jgi:hypothetical protein
MAKRLLCLALLASATVAGAQQPIPAPPVPEGLPTPQLPQPEAADGPLIVPSNIVNIRLDPSLGDALPAVRKALAGLPVQIAEPADYEITTERAFPQSLVAIDRRQSRSDWDTNFHPTDGRPRPEPRTFALGNLVVGDYRTALQDLVTRALRAKSLLALQSSVPVAVDTCFGWAVHRPDGSIAYRCSQADTYDQDSDESYADDFGVGVSNKSTTPRYVALLTVEPFLGIQRLQMNGMDPNTPLAPGARGHSKISQLLNSRSERFYLVTITSDRPIDTSSIEQPTIERRDKLGCGDAPECHFAPMRSDDHWQVSVNEYRVHRPRLAGIGGGLSVLDGMARWMAEFYSTVPYTREEIAEDKRKKPEDQQHLSERMTSELVHRCGASLIAPNLVVTAAHCVAKGKYAGDGMRKVLVERRVRIGTMYLGSGGTTYAIDGVAIPSSYRPDKQDNDIALLLIKADRDTVPIKVPTIAVGQRSPAGGTPLAALGWGYTGEVAAQANPLFNVARELQRNPTHLQVGIMNTLPALQCRKKLAQKWADAMLCMVSPPPPADDPNRIVFSCRGDSGGPLVRDFGKRDELVGVTSWSMGCGHNGFPSVYTDVTKFARWIDAARRQLRPGAAITVDDPAAPAPRTVRRH